MYMDYTSDLSMKDRRRSILMNDLRKRLQNDPDYGDTRIYVSLPLADGHNNHIPSPESVMGNRVDDTVKTKIREFVSDGITNLDYDEAEIGAVTAEFPDGKILMCAFHREQAWERWSRSEDNVPSEDREEFLRHLRAVADAPSEETLQEAIQSLEEKSFYRGSLRRYVESKWLSVKESWCRACIAPGFHLPVTTNNGVETLNKSLKHFYLKLSSSASLSNLVQIIFKDFLPDLYQTYLMLNFRSTSNFKPYQGIPSYLHDRPHHIVQHMLKRLSKGEEDFQSSDISLNTVGLYTVKSDSRKYTVSLGSESAYPDCSCDDFRRNFLPCKHMFAVFTFTNSDFLDLPLLYRSNPLLTLDTSSVKTHSGLCALTRQPVTEEAISSTKEDSIDTVKVQRNVLSKLKHIQTLVYLCKDNNTLQNANDLLEEVATALKENVPHDANLPLGPSAKLRKLPTRRKIFQTAWEVSAQSRCQSPKDASCSSVRNW
ncbi:uncharacterized protein [Argopecten irradians]|uniref:uncharacterized protein n=1 Tax=Argopecten irradians TaxID=31199 RepID=UPI00371C19B9